MEEKEILRRLHTYTEVIICEICKGTGVYTWKELEDYHKGDYETMYAKCDKCKGTGRLLKTKKYMEYTEPFDKSKHTGKNSKVKL